MKEIDIQSLFKEKTKMEVTQQKKQEYKLVHQGTIVPHENHTLWEIDIETNVITPAKFHKKDYIFNPKWRKGTRLKSHSEVIINEGKVYVSALNEENAMKKYYKGCNGTKIDHNKTYLQL